jgi:hypothetical protein
MGRAWAQKRNPSAERELVATVLHRTTSGGDRSRVMFSFPSRGIRAALLAKETKETVRHCRAASVNVTPITGHHVGEAPPSTPPLRPPEPLPSRRLRGRDKLLGLSVSWIYTLCSGLAKTHAREGFLRDLAVDPIVPATFSRPPTASPATWALPGVPWRRPRVLRLTTASHSGS